MAKKIDPRFRIDPAFKIDPMLQPKLNPNVKRPEINNRPEIKPDEFKRKVKR